MTGFEPASLTLHVVVALEAQQRIAIWSQWMDSNHQGIAGMGRRQSPISTAMVAEEGIEPSP